MSGEALVYPLGSSPLSRGIPSTAFSQAMMGRIIPALAGNTYPSTSFLGSNKDHPRSRGEYALFREHYTNGGGSSPLSRGILVDEVRFPVVAGIIPALAGNTTPQRSSASAATDHPRSRGEYICEIWARHSRYGSSPLSRGILYRLFRESGTDGIIPALAGNTPSLHLGGTHQGDHPRSRGEYAPQ